MKYIIEAVDMISGVVMERYTRDSREDARDIIRELNRKYRFDYYVEIQVSDPDGGVVVF